ncbi:NAD(P)-binding protein [Lepidopterella palustris CBS 459.81]|uniref:NAD(P)-binding protein n=1 Tax=Lepidopterella palustris CBS 459.81 TaxID=1314670 RepID=A0A8E2JGH3_9PEZI|nr:NAD(P)-binding protein [Lepidopterella palustris CBS 459.81]
MPYNLKGRNVLITGGSRGLGAVIASAFAAEGCNIAINYANNKKPAAELQEKLINEYAVRACVIKGDAGLLADCAHCVEETIKTFGGIDIVIGNAGWTKFAKFSDLDAMAEEDWDKCWAVNVKGQMALLRAAMPTFNENPDGGVFIITSSIAGVSQSGSSMAYSVTKAAQLHLMRCLASTQGKKVRINAVLPGLLLTEWGLKYSSEHIQMIKNNAVLKMETDLNDCANAYVMIAKNSSMTGQKIQIDAGLCIGSP